MAQNNLDLWIELDSGEKYACVSGGIVGRGGNIGTEFFRRADVVSRRHLVFMLREATWFLTLLPSARNRTFFDGEEMKKGTAYRISSRHTIQIASLTFHVETGKSYEFRTNPVYSMDTIMGGPNQEAVAEAPSGAPQPNPAAPPLPAASPATPLPSADPLSSYHSSMAQGPASIVPGGSQFGTQGGLGVDPSSSLSSTYSPVIVETLQDADLSSALLSLDGKCVWATRKAEREWGLSPYISEQDRFVEMVEPEFRVAAETALNEAERHTGKRELSVKLAKGTYTEPVTLEILRSGDYFILSEKADGVPHHDSEESTDEIRAQLKTLAFFSLSKAFQEGDIAKGMSLLTVNCCEALDCSRVRVWLNKESDNRYMICRGDHSVVSNPSRIGTELNKKRCWDFFSRVERSPYIGSEDSQSPVFRMLREIGFVELESTSVLVTALQLGGEIQGHLVFEKGTQDAAWSEPERHFAMCAANFALLAVQTYKHRSAFATLQRLQREFENELEAATKYVEKTLPEPISEGKVTCEWEWLPMDGLGGDSFGYHWIDDRYFAMYIIDVVGHGIRAAFLSTSVINAVRTQLLPVEDFRDAGAVVAATNQAFPMEEHDDYTFTMWYGVFDSVERKISYSSGGHPPGLLFEGLDRLSVELVAEGCILGAVPESEYPTLEYQMQADSAKFYLFTDGAFEIPIGPNRMWTLQQFSAAAKVAYRMDGGEPSYLLKRVRSLCTDKNLPDDFCVVRFTFSA